MGKTWSWIIIIVLCIWWGKSCSSTKIRNMSSQNHQKEWVMDYTDGINGNKYHFDVVFLEKNDNILHIAFLNDSGVKVAKTTLTKKSPNQNYKWWGKWVDDDRNWGYLGINEVYIDGHWQLVGFQSDGRRSDNLIHYTVISQK